LKTANQAVTSISGAHKSGKTNADVVGIWVKKEETQYLPTGFPKFFPNVKSYWIEENSKLKEIANANFNDFSNLKELYIRNNNKLESLPKGVFEGLDKLLRLSLHHNNLKTIDNEVLWPFLNSKGPLGYKSVRPFKTLEDLDFTRNSCINHEYREHERDTHDSLVRIQQVIEDRC